MLSRINLLPESTEGTRTIVFDPPKSISVEFQLKPKPINKLINAYE